MTKKEILKALQEKRITGDEAKALIRDDRQEIGIFCFIDDMTEMDYLIKSGREKMGLFGGVVMEGSFHEVFELD